MNIIRIGIDASGGDHGPDEIIKGGVLAEESHPGIEVVVYSRKGNTRKVGEVQIQHCEGNELKVAFADLRSREIQAIITARRSDHLLGAARDSREPGVERPCLLVPMPSEASSGLSYIADGGATNEERDPEVFRAWATIGRRFLQNHKGIAEPRVGLVSIVGEVKRANPKTVAIHEVLEKVPGYIGLAEPAPFMEGKINLWLMDGDRGNLILKYAEAWSSFIFRKVKAVVPEANEEVVRNLKALRDELLSYEAHVISPLLGVGGWVFRVHGNAKAEVIKLAFLAACKNYRLSESI